MDDGQKSFILHDKVFAIQKFEHVLDAIEFYNANQGCRLGGATSHRSEKPQSLSCLVVVDGFVSWWKSSWLNVLASGRCKVE